MHDHTLEGGSAAAAYTKSEKTYIPVGINGFGRIGRNVFRASLLRTDVRVVAINHTCATAEDLLFLFRHDSIHREFAKDVGASVAVVDDKTLRVGDHEVTLMSSRDPTQLDWASAGAQYIAECTGKMKTRALASGHFTSRGVRNVVISAPSDDAPTIVYGVNEADYRPSGGTMDVISCASCTTNCVAPVAKVLDQEFGIEEAFVTTVHAATQSQSILDGYKSKSKRSGRSVIGNIIPASTGAAKAVAKVVPSLQGKLSAMALRVPVADVSVVDLTVHVRTPTSLEVVLDRLRAASRSLPSGVLGVCEEELVSSDFIGNACSAVIDAPGCSEMNSTFFKILAWYDNEWAYSTRILDLIAYIAGRNEPAVENGQAAIVH
ncbi:hypothetical protein VTK73DRAFT_227 [Phialemonium thermophilum]|uniref:glyceraldehyde-3-phosphate dehydrogenase (phosphorylating) n=1 Tax=Phialemonium thermophilum TaxID=223376 RepID=A0ABR3XFM3_9PEZI